MTLKKKLIASAVGGALSLGFGISAQAEHDPVLLAPYVVKDTNRTTLITIMGQDGASVASGPSIHLQYWTKSTTDANTAACQPNSTTITFTENDIVTFDTAGLLGPGPLFGDTTNLAPLGTSISYAGPRHGYLVIQSAESNDSFLGRGFWKEVDLANGGAHGDILFGNNQNENTDSNFNNHVQDHYSLHPSAPNPNPNTNGDGSPVAFWPSSVASTVFTVTPLGTAMLTSDNNVAILRVFNSNDVQGAYDRNENGVDGTVPQTVRCVGRLTAAQLMPGVVANAAWAATGGWGWLVNLGDGDAVDTEGCGTGTGDCHAVVYQVDTSTAAGAGKFMQDALRIQSNNDNDED